MTSRYHPIVEGQRSLYTRPRASRGPRARARLPARRASSSLPRARAGDPRMRAGSVLLGAVREVVSVTRSTVCRACPPGRIRDQEREAHPPNGWSSSGLRRRRPHSVPRSSWRPYAGRPTTGQRLTEPCGRGRPIRVCGTKDGSRRGGRSGPWVVRHEDLHPANGPSAANGLLLSLTKNTAPGIDRRTRSADWARDVEG